MNRPRTGITRMPFVLAVPAIATVLAAAPARADLWKCIEDNGQPIYTSEKIDLKRYKGCQPLNAPISTVHPYKGSTAKSNPGPASFPSVSSTEQKARDGDRRKILETELSNEEKLLAEARRKLKEQEELRLGSEKNFARVEERVAPFQKQVQLHESNIANIQKEISALR